MVRRTFSIGDALGSGFGVIFGHPLAVLAWALTFLVLGLLPHLAIFSLIAPDIADLIRQAHLQGHGEHPADFPALMHMQTRLMALQPIGLLSTILVRAVLACAVFRAVLEPRNSAFGYLRFGAQELWTILVMLVMTVLAVLLALGLAIPVVILAVATGVSAHQDQAGSPALGIALALAVIAAMAVFLWILLRLSLALPMTFADRTFRLFESWSLTRGQTLKLFLVVLCLIVITWLVELVCGTLVFGGLAGVVGRGDRLMDFFAHPPADWLNRAAPWIGLAGVVVSLVAAALSAIWLAPWALVYRELSAPPPAPADFGG